MGIELGEEVRIIIGGTKEERIVHVALLAGECLFLFQSLDGRSLRHGIGHIEIRGHATCRCRPTLSIDISLFRQTRLTEVHMIIDDARQNETSRGIDHFIERCFGSCISF